jgi:hypothetical protein
MSALSPLNPEKQILVRTVSATNLIATGFLRGFPFQMARDEPPSLAGLVLGL